MIKSKALVGNGRTGPNISPSSRFFRLHLVSVALYSTQSAANINIIAFMVAIKSLVYYIPLKHDSHHAHKHTIYVWLCTQCHTHTKCSTDICIYAQWACLSRCVYDFLNSDTDNHTTIMCNNLINPENGQYVIWLYCL